MLTRRSARWDRETAREVALAVARQRAGLRAVEEDAEDLSGLATRSAEHTSSAHLDVRIVDDDLTVGRVLRRRGDRLSRDDGPIAGHRRRRRRWRWFFSRRRLLGRRRQVVGGGEVEHAVEEEVARYPEVVEQVFTREHLGSTELALVEVDLRRSGELDHRAVQRHADLVGQVDEGTRLLPGGHRADHRKERSFDCRGRTAGLHFEGTCFGDLCGPIPGGTDRERPLGLTNTLLLAELGDRELGVGPEPCVGTVGVRDLGQPRGGVGAERVSLPEHLAARALLELGLLLRLDVDVGVRIVSLARIAAPDAAGFVGFGFVAASAGAATTRRHAIVAASNSAELARFARTDPRPSCFTGRFTHFIRLGARPRVDRSRQVS